jgi:hypothetical protein
MESTSGEKLVLRKSLRKGADESDAFYSYIACRIFAGIGDELLC